MADAFSSYHPVVNLLYFILALGVTMTVNHPVFLFISLAGSLAYAFYLNRRRAVRFNLLFMLPVLLMTALLNPIFNHEGATILTYLRDDNPLTLESIVYGVAAAVMLASVINWFSCVNAVFTSDKFIYLFGRVLPALSLILSMSLRFIPRFKAQAKTISAAQSSIGRDAGSGGIAVRIRHSLRLLSVMITWSLESAIETADSMKSRGYGLKGRTAYSIYRFDNRDWRALAFISACGVYIITGYLLGGISWRYFPTIKGTVAEPFAVSVYAVYFLLCLMPVLINVREDVKWKRLRSIA